MHLYLSNEAEWFQSSVKAAASFVSKDKKEALETFMLRSGKVESVEVHDFVPHRYKVVKEFLLGVVTSVDFRQGPELGVRTED